MRLLTRWFAAFREFPNGTGYTGRVTNVPLFCLYLVNARKKEKNEAKGCVQIGMFLVWVNEDRGVDI